MARKKAVPVIDEVVEPSAETITQDPALAMILSHMELMAREQRLIASAVQQLKVETDERVNQLHTQLAQERDAAMQGLSATMEEMWKQFEARAGKLLDQSSLKQTLDQLAEEQQKLGYDKQQAFIEALGSKPTGQIINYTTHSIPLTINRVTHVVQPGVNLDVPYPFMELWGDMQEATTLAVKRNNQIANQVLSADKVDLWRDEGKTVGLTENVN